MEISEIGNSRLVRRHLGFLESENNMIFSVAEMSDTSGVEDPTYVYSYYNLHGCFSLVEIAQRQQWDCFVADKYSEDPRLRLVTEIRQTDYLTKRVYFARTFLKMLSNFIRDQIAQTGVFWGIRIG